MKSFTIGTVQVVLYISTIETRTVRSEGMANLKAGDFGKPRQKWEKMS
jgi:hypothetical protein